MAARRGIFGSARNLFGRAVSGVGSAIGLPEFGISERVSGQPRPQITPQAAATGPVFGPPAPFIGPQRPGQVLGAQAPTFGGGGGGGAPAAPGGGQPPLEQAPQAPQQIDFDAIIQPGLQALSQAEEAAQGVFSAGEAQIESGRAGAVSAAEQAGTAAGQQVASQQASEERRGGEAVGEQRRGFAQIARNLASRFGQSISTGLGAEAIAGQQALQNIGRIRAGLAETMADLNTRRQSIQDITQNSIKEAESSANVLRQQARSGLQSALAEIGARRGELQSRRAELVFSAVENFRNTVSDVNARNASFQQQLFRDQQAADSSLQNAIARAQQTSQNLPSFELSPGQTKFLPTQNLPQGFGLPEGTDVTQGTAGPFTTFSAPGAEGAESPEERINRLFGTAG